VSSPVDSGTPANDAAIKIPGVIYHSINLNGTAFSLALMRQLSWTNIARLLYLMALGYRTQAISILGTNVMTPRGLDGLAYDTLKHSTAEILAVFKVLADVSSFPVLVHCTQGKDRTGLIVLLVLMLLGVDREAIDKDYMISQGELLPEKEDRLKEIRSIGLPDEFAGCPDNWVESVHEHINTDYGGVEKYLLSCGVTEDMEESLKGIFLEA